MAPDFDPRSLPPGLVAVVGDEGSGKTRLLRRIERDLPGDAFWLDPSLPGLDDRSAPQLWAQWQRAWPAWNPALQQDLAQALQLAPHLGKQLFMLSTGSRRKVALVALLASGARVTCLDQPFAALDAAAIRVVLDFLADQAGHPSRTWVVADYTADPRLPWRQLVHLG